MLWAIALGLEDGDISQAERDLRAAERNLREALSRGASEEEIARLTAELRAALDAFLKALTEQAMRNGDRQAPHDSQGSSRSLSEQDIKSLLDQMEKASRSGDLAQAQQLLDELQEMMENLQPSQGGSSAQSREMARALSEIDRLAREEQQLRDDTHRGGMRSGDEAADARAMRERQRALRERLQQQKNRLRQLNEETPRDLSDADAAMKEAEDALGKSGDAARDKAVDAQGRAVQSLRRGADQLASRMKGEGDDGDDGQGRRPGRAGRQGQGDDPLGRSAGRRGGNNDRARYDPMGLPPALRAHRLQEELRRRLGEPQRPAEELDYIERLLRR
jgi:DNA repair exonuclease SbcCD ATPase subunit